MIDALAAAAEYRSAHWLTTVTRFDMHQPLQPPTADDQFIHSFKRRVLQSASTTRLWTHYAQTHAYRHWAEVADHTIAEFTDILRVYERQLDAYCREHPDAWTVPGQWTEMWTGLFDIQKIRGSLAIEHCMVPHAGTLAVETTALGATASTTPPSPDDTRRPPHELWIVQPNMDPDTWIQHRQHNPHLGYIIGVRDSESHWNTQLKTTSSRGRGFQVCSVQESVLLQSRWLRRMTRTRGRDRRRHATQHTTITWWYFPPVQLPAKERYHTLDIHTYTAALRGKFQTRQGRWYLPPTCFLPRSQVTREYDHLWDELANERKAILDSGQAQGHERLANNLNNTIDILKYSPCRHIAKVAGLSKALYSPLDKPGYYVYAMLHKSMGRVYVGMVGKTGPRPMVDRAWEHYAAGRPTPTRVDKEIFYKTMENLGRHDWIMVPLEVCHSHTVRAAEQRWMRRLGKVFNKEQKYKGSRWATLKGPLRERGWTSVNCIRRLAHDELRRQRTHTSSRLLLQLLLDSKRHIDPDKHAMLLHKVRHKLWQRCRVRIPTIITIPYPVGNQTSLRELKRAYRMVLGRSGLPQSTVEYIESVMRFVGKRGPTVTEILSSRATKWTWDDIEHYATSPCNCHRYSGVTKIDNCVFVRDPKQQAVIHGKQAMILNQNAKNCTIPKWETMHEAMTNTIKQLGRVSGPQREQVREGAYITFMEDLTNMWRQAKQQVPPQLHAGLLQEFTENAHRKGLMFTAVDKNAGKIATICRKLYCQKLLGTFQDKNQFRHVKTSKTTMEAKATCLQRMYRAAQRFGLDDQWQWGAGKTCPHAYIIPKNKMADRTDSEWKQRVIFSYAKHPLKAYSRLMGRALTIMVEQGARTLQTLEMTRLDGVVSWAQRANTRLRHTPDGTPWETRACAQHTASTPQATHSDPLYTMWELDIKDFFPSLNRTATLKAVDALHALLVQKLNKRVKKQEGMWFALHKEHKKLDRVGQGSKEQFHNVPYAALREFLEYELHHNALFCVGNTILEQIKGVAIGGTCSAQLSSIFTMVQEHRFYSKPWTAQKSLINQHFPVHMVPTRPFRFRDNLVGQGFALQHLSAVQSFFEKLYTLKLQEEGVGTHLPTLEAVLHTHPLSGHIDISLKNKLQDQQTLSPGQQLIRYPDAHSPNARATLQSLIPALAKKCVQYSSTGDLFADNATTVHRELTAKGYPRSWWENKFKLHLLQHTRNTPHQERTRQLLRMFNATRAGRTPDTLPLSSAI